MSAAFLTAPSAERFQVLAASEQTGGAFGLVAATLIPGEAPPPHIHHGEDETYYVLDGHLRICVGAEELEVGTGALVFAPRGIPHHIVVESPSARLLTLVTPGGLERYLATVAKAVTGDMGVVLPLALEHRIEILTPPLSGWSRPGGPAPTRAHRTSTT